MKIRPRYLITAMGFSVTMLTLANANAVQADQRELLPSGAAELVTQTDGFGYDVLMAAAQSRGKVRVIVRLRSDYQVEGQLAAAQAVQDQRAVIAGLQNSLLNSMAYHDMSAVKQFKYIPYMAMEVDAAALAELRASSEVVGIIEDFTLEVSLAESVPLIGADKTRAAGYSGAGQTIAILDTGVDKTHPSLQGKVVAEACFSTNYAPASATTVCPNGLEEQIGDGAGVHCQADSCDHGTHVAGIAAGQQGVAKDADIIAIQVFSQDNSAQSCSEKGYQTPCTTAFFSDIVRGLEHVYELREHFDIAAVNMSLGGGKFTAACDAVQGLEPVRAIIDNLRFAGIASVVASGNDGHADGIGIPACFSSAISVGATDKSDHVANFSNSADFLHLLAPGVSIISTVPGGGFQAMNGTSMAAPHVAGAWAVLKSRAPEAGVDQILSALIGTGVPVTDHRNGITKPRIQIDSALTALDENGGEPDVPGPLALISPIGTITETLPTYQWGAVPGAAWYYLWVQDGSGQQVIGQYVTPEAVGCGSGTDVCSIKAGVELTVGQNYTWWIAAGDDVGNYEWSEGASFQVTGVQPLTLLSPVGTITETLPTYQWSAVPGAAWYYLWVQDGSGQQVIGGYVSPSQAGCGSGSDICAIRPDIALTIGQSYDWWVAVGDNANNYKWSDGRSFMIAQ